MKKIRILLPLFVILTLIAGSACARSVFWVEGDPDPSGEPARRLPVNVLSFRLGIEELHGDPEGYKYLLIFEFSHPVKDESSIVLARAARSSSRILPKFIFTRHDGAEIDEYIFENVSVQELKEHFDPDTGEGIQDVTLTAKSKKRRILVDPEDMPKTGDPAPLCLWALLAASSCAAFFLIRKSLADRADS